LELQRPEPDQSTLHFSTLTSADLSGSVVTGADFSGTNGFTKQQLYATASYQAKNLWGIGLGVNNLSGWDFSGQNLAKAWLFGSTLTNANLSGADARGARFDQATLTGANVRNLIQTNGHIAGLDLTAGASLVIRNYDRSPTPGTSVGPVPILVDQHLAMDAAGTLQLVFDADAWDSTISFQPGIPVALGGTLELTFAPDVDVPTQSGRTIDLFDWTGVNPTGQFQVASPYAWDLSNLYTTGEVTLLSLHTPGDANGDGNVNRLDLALLTQNFGLADGALWSDGDFDGNGRVNLLDVAILKSHFEQSVMAPTAAVPEPSSIVLMLVGLIATVALTRLHTVRN